MAPKFVLQCKTLLGAIGALLKYYLFDLFYKDMDGVLTVSDDGNPLMNNNLIVPLKEMNSAGSKFHFNARYLIPLCLFFSYFLDLIYILIFTDFKWNGTGTEKAVPLIRKLLPKQVSQNTDVLFTALTLMMVGLVLEHLFHNMEQFERKYRMVALVYSHDGSFKEMAQNGIVYPTAEGEAIYKFNCKGKKLAHLLAVGVYGFSLPFFHLNIALNWTRTATDVKACLWITVCMPYFCLNLYVAVLCFVFNCRNLRIRQRYQINRLQSLIVKGNRTVGFQLAKGKRKRGPIRLKSYWSEFSLLNYQLNAQSEQINGFSRFWSRYLSLYFTGLIFLVAYTAFIILKLDKSQNLLVVAFLASVDCILFSFLLWITLECSVLVVNNKETLKLQRIFTVHTSLAGRIPLLAAIKFDHIEADSKSIDRIGFKLLDSVQINSKMFELLFFYISSLFMKIVQNEL